MDQPRPAKYLEREMDPLAREFYGCLERGQLSTTRCTQCGKTSFPPRRHCDACGAEESWVTLPEHGRLYAFTTQETALRFRAPAVLALVQLGDAILPGVVDAPYDQLRIGQRVRAELRPEPDTGLTLVAFVPEQQPH